MLLRTSFALLVCCCLVGGCSSGETVAPQDSNAASSRVDVTPSVASLDVRIAPFTNFYFLVRAQAGGVLEIDPTLQPVIDAWMPVQQARGAWGGMWQFDLAGMLADSPAEFGEWFDEREESVEDRGREVPIRGPGKAMASAMETAWPAWREAEWPALEERLSDAHSRLQEEFLPRHREAFGYMLQSLQIEDPEVELGTYLAWEIHPPGASTYRSNDGPVAVLSVRDLLGEGRFSDLTETVLHEATHALDGASRGDGDAFSRLRTLLEERGIERRDQRHHDVPHLVMFVQSEETMRRLFDPDHVAYGDTRRGDIAPLYERHGGDAVIVRREWRSYLDGNQSMEEALVSIADAVAGS